MGEPRMFMEFVWQYLLMVIIITPVVLSVWGVRKLVKKRSKS